MIELPESAHFARQINESLKGLRVKEARAGTSPHGFAFFTGNPEDYSAALEGQTILAARAFGGILEVDFGGLMLLFSDGASLRLYPTGAARPPKHQLLLEMENGAALACTVLMYAGIHLCPTGEYHSVYHQAAHEKPSPLDVAFTEEYFLKMAEECPKLSAKAFLATQQRIPGLGNGVLQDILFRARINPRTVMSALSAEALTRLFKEVKATLRDMTEKGGRDTEKDLYGKPGGYQTLMSKASLDRPCPGCGGTVKRESYLGGNVYFCPNCQPVVKG